jgi:phospholipase C
MNAGNATFVPQTKYASQNKIQHVVILVQENRSFDNFFDCFPGTDCVKNAPGPGPQPGPTTHASPCPNPVSTSTPGPTPTPIKLHFGAALRGYDIDHTYCSAFVTEYDGGKLDGFYWAAFIQPGVPAGKYPYQVVGKKFIQPYWDMATQYVLADRMFATQASASFTAHQDLIRGDTLINSTQAIVDNPGPGAQWGCPAKHDVTSLLTTSNKINDLHYLPQQGPYPCFTYATLRDILDAKGVTWKYYVPIWPNNGGQEWNAFASVQAVFSAKGTEYPNKAAPFTCTQSCVSWPETNVFCDVSQSASPCPSPPPSGSSTLPAVSWVIPDGLDSDHGYPYKPPGPDNGPDWVASIVNAIGESPYWKSTAIVVVWDDWGGFYDHVPPPQLDYEGLGFRIPMIIISPYAKRGYVSHTQYEFGSLLKFIEQTYSLGSLGTTDVRANSISDAFNFNQPPHKFTPITLLNKAHGRAYFLRRPPSNEPVDTQ